MHLERVEDEEEEDSHDQGDDEDQDEAKPKTKRNVSIDNYIAWGILQVPKNKQFLAFYIVIKLSFHLILTNKLHSFIGLSSCCIFTRSGNGARMPPRWFNICYSRKTVEVVRV